MKFFAVVPAAGLSLRMGCEKLLLPWPANGESTIVEATLAAWKRSQVDLIVVTVRQEQTRLAEICERLGAHVAVAKTPPPDMKASALIALDYVRANFAPEDGDAWLLAPADMPRLSTAAIDALCDAHREKLKAGGRALILLPTIAGRRGHPVLFPWPLAEAARALAQEEGLNQLSSRIGHEAIDLSDRLSSDILDDIDTPEDFQRIARFNSSPS